MGATKRYKASKKGTNKGAPHVPKVPRKKVKKAPESGAVSRVQPKSKTTKSDALESFQHYETMNKRGDRKIYRYETSKEPSLLESIVGFLAASIFSLAYFIVPTWILTAMALLMWQPLEPSTWFVIVPIMISYVVPPVPMRWLLRTWPFRVVPAYFQYREILETSHEDLQKLVEEKPTIISLHPHGVFSLCALCAAIKWSISWWYPATTPTAVADSILHLPLLKHIIGVLGITSASGKQLVSTITAEKNRGCILYPGGTAELFLTNPDRERLHLLDRKGFIKIALTEGCVIVPGYLFGNSRVLRLWQSTTLRHFARKTGFAITYLYGRFFLPMPLPEPCLCAIGTPLHLPKIASPTKKDIDHWHAIYVKEIVRIFDDYKEETPGYENKKLELE